MAHDVQAVQADRNRRHRGEAGLNFSEVPEITAELINTTADNPPLASAKPPAGRRNP